MPNNKSSQLPAKKKQLNSKTTISNSDKLALIGLIVATLTLVSSLVIPEIRKNLGLEETLTPIATETSNIPREIATTEAPIFDGFNANTPNSTVLPNNVTSSTPIGFNTYDDPLGLYSFDLPSDFVIVSRINLDTQRSIKFTQKKVGQTENASESHALKDAITGLVKVGVLSESVILSDLDSVNENFLIQTLGDNYSEKRNLVYNQKTSKGYLIKLEEIGGIDHSFIYYLVEYDGRAFILLMFTTNEESDLVYNEKINHSIKSFTWDAKKILRHFSVQ
jgi:hypothetical protein